MAILVTYSRGPRKRRPLTPLGKALLEGAQQQGITLAGLAAEIGCARTTLTRIMYEPRHWLSPRIRTALGLSAVALAKLMSQQGAVPKGRIDRCARCGRKVYRPKGWGGTGQRRPRFCWDCYNQKRQVEVSCDHCGIPLTRGKLTASKSEHHFCSLEHCWAWRRDRGHPGKRSRSGHRSGRHLAATRARLQSRSQRAVAADAGVSLGVVKGIVAGKGKPQEVTRYRLEKVGYLPPRDRPPVVVAILEFCVDADISLRRLAAVADIERKTLAEIVSGQRTPMSPTLVKLAAAMNRRAEELEVLAGPVRRRPPKLPPHRPVTFTRRQALEVRRLRDEEGLSWPEIGRRMSWPVKLDRRGAPCDCRKARRAYTAASP